MTNREELEKITAKRDEVIIEQVNDWNLNWDHIWMHYNWEQLAQLLTERVSHVLDNIGATKDGLHYAMEIERKLNKKYPFDNSKEANLKQLAIRKATLDKEIEWQKARDD